MGDIRLSDWIYWLLGTGHRLRLLFIVFFILNILFFVIIPYTKNTGKQNGSQHKGEEQTQPRHVPVAERLYLNQGLICSEILNAIADMLEDSRFCLFVILPSILIIVNFLKFIFPHHKYIENNKK